jgi:hypothetical protein
MAPFLNNTFTSWNYKEKTGIIKEKKRPLKSAAQNLKTSLLNTIFLQSLPSAIKLIPGNN